MRTGKQAAEQMKLWHEKGRSGVKGLCLKTCREAFLIPARYPSAIISWNRTPNKYKNKDYKKAGVGALHYYEGGKYGHIVIQSEIKNKVWGTDLKITDKVGLHHWRLPVAKWKYKYLGWSYYLNGKEVKIGNLPK